MFVVVVQACYSPAIVAVSGIAVWPRSSSASPAPCRPASGRSPPKSVGVTIPPAHVAVRKRARRRPRPTDSPRRQSRPPIAQSWTTAVLVVSYGLLFAVNRRRQRNRRDGRARRRRRRRRVVRRQAAHRRSRSASPSSCPRGCPQTCPLRPRQLNPRAVNHARRSRSRGRPPRWWCRTSFYSPQIVAVSGIAVMAALVVGVAGAV